MATGLIALLDDIATIADDVAKLTYLATKKTTGIVTDDMAVTAEQTLGLQRDREIPVVLAVARGSFLNKALFLAPGALALSLVAPWLITPILMLGGTYLCFEGVEKFFHKALHRHDDHHDAAHAAPVDPVALEKQRVAGAIRTDFILSGEVIAIALGEVQAAPFVQQVAALYSVSVVMTVGVYGLVLALVKLDDVGEALALSGGPQAPVGRAIVAAAPKILATISWVGMVAMLLVGGHILIEGIGPLHHAVHDLLHDLGGVAHWAASTAIDLAVGALAGVLVVGALATGIPARLWALRPGAR